MSGFILFYMEWLVQSTLVISTSSGPYKM